MQCEITWVEVFAPEPLGGNLLPVLSPADGVADEALATVARRFQQPETSFVQTADDGRAGYRHRIFTVAGELPFAGHPSLGTAAAVARARAETNATYVQQTISGLQTLEVELTGDAGHVSIDQNPAEFGEVVDAAQVLGAIGLVVDDLHAELRPQVVSTGLPCLVLPVAGLDALTSATCDPAALATVLPATGAQTVYAVADAGDHWRARAFSPVVALGEDAATGSAVGPFGAYVREYVGTTSVLVRQGIEMGSPSVLEVDTADGVRVRGAVRIVGTGHHELPRLDL